MPTANTTSPKPRRKAARKATTRKPAKAVTRRTSASKAKATHAKAARTRAVHSAESAVRQSQTATRETSAVFGDYAERAVLIPVGAALIAREKVLTSVADTISAYSTGSKAQAQLRRFERRGVTARKRLEREVRKARVRVERELRQRRREIENTLSDTVNEIEGRRDAIAKNGSELASSVQERLLSLV